MSIVLDQKVTEMRMLVDRYAGQRLPSERDLAEQLAISRPSVRAILAVLEAEGLIQRRHGSGTYPTRVRAERLQRVILLVDQDIKLGNDPFFTLLVEQIQKSLQKQGIRSILERIGRDGPLPYLEQGVITFGLAGEAVLNSLRDDAPPVVCLFLGKNLRPRVRVSIIELADEKAGEEAVQHLFNSGYSALIFMGNLKIPGTLKRLSGVKKRAAENEMPLEIIECSQNFNGGFKSGKQLDLSSKPGPLGIIVSNDWLALGLRSGLAEKSAKISAVPIVSFDGLAVTNEPSLNIHSLAVPFDTIAEDVVIELLRMDQSKGAVGRSVSYELYWPDKLATF
jgi:DNA-binding LacI/PurR family transcriptional regulator